MSRRFCISGTHPRTGETRIYATYAPESEIPEYIRRGESEGWTNLVPYRQPNPSLWTDEEVPEETPKTGKRRGKKK